MTPTAGGPLMAGRPVLEVVDAWWRAANYLSVGQLYLLDNPLLAEPLTIDHVKPRLLGHWGTTPGLNLVWAHLNRLIVERRLSAMFVCGPGHGGPAAVANPWLEGTYGELYPDVGWSVDGMRRLFRQFSFPGGVPSHAAPTTPGSIHEGGELGYALAHAYGASFDAPETTVFCVVGDGEAETGPTAASWHSHRFVQAGTDGEVVPILHLNGYKIANPTVLARIPESELRSLFVGYGYQPWIVAGDDPSGVHEALAGALDEIADRLDERRRSGPAGLGDRPGSPPMLILRTPKGWTGPDELDGLPVEGHYRSHQIPVGHDAGPERLTRTVEDWMRSYHPEELFSPTAVPLALVDALRPPPGLRMSANPRTNGGTVMEELVTPPIERYAVPVGGGGDRRSVSAMDVAGSFVRDVIDGNRTRFRLFGPDEVESNRLSAVFEVTDRVWPLATDDDDVNLAREGRVMEVLSEHLCQGWLEGYLLTGRHGLFTSYEAFAHIADSMFNQHTKWLDSASEVPWRQPVPSLTYLLSSHVWRQDHNGFTHQDPGFLDVVANKAADLVRLYLPPDANSLLVTLERCFDSRHMVNVVVAGKQPEPQYLSLDEARHHLAAGMGTWPWAGTEEERGRPEVVLACSGDVPTMETLAAAELLGGHSDLSIRVVNVVDLLRLRSGGDRSPGLPDADYDRHLPPGVPTIFAFHGYPWLIHRLTYRRANHDDLHVHGYQDRGTTTTPFDMVVMNRLDRFHLALAAIDRLPVDRQAALVDLRRRLVARLSEHQRHIETVGDDLPSVTDWSYQR